MAIITQTQAVKLFLAGSRLLVGEYRASKADTINWRDKTTGKPLTAGVLKFVVECGSDSVSVSEKTPDTFNAEAYKCPYVKGQQVVIEVFSITVDKGSVSCRGKTHPLEK